MVPILIILLQRGLIRHLRFFHRCGLHCEIWFRAQLGGTFLDPRALEILIFYLVDLFAYQVVHVLGFLEASELQPKLDKNMILTFPPNNFPFIIILKF